MSTFVCVYVRVCTHTSVVCMWCMHMHSCAKVHLHLFTSLIDDMHHEPYMRYLYS